MTELFFEIRPTCDSELSKALEDARRGPGQAQPVSATFAGLLFQFSDQTILGRDETLLGPYCSSCRKALLLVSYTEWTTADPIEAELEALCPHCGGEIGTRESMAQLRRQALAALKSRLAGIEKGQL